MGPEVNGTISIRILDILIKLSSKDEYRHTELDSFSEQ